MVPTHYWSVHHKGACRLLVSTS